MTSPWHHQLRSFVREDILMVLTLEGRVPEVIQPDLFSHHYRLKLGVHRRPVTISLSLEVIPRLHRSHRYICLNPENVMDVERLHILGEIVQNRVTDPNDQRRKWSWNRTLFGRTWWLR